MITLNTLTNNSNKRKSITRVGRGIGSGRGKTSGRGHKGQGSRSGARKRYGYEGGQFRTFMKFPIRGFNNKRFQKRLDTINLKQIEKTYNDGDTVNLQTLREHGFISGKSYGIKILGEGELTKKVKIEANACSDQARQKLQQAKIEITITPVTVATRPTTKKEKPKAKAETKAKPKAATKAKPKATATKPKAAKPKTTTKAKPKTTKSKD